MALVKTTIDGKEIEVERDCWALDAARRMGISVPTLCHHPALEPYGACRLCVVEVTRGKWTWLTTSCDLPIREGLTIRTDTPEVIKSRKMAIELLWSRAPEAESLEIIAKQLGLEKPRFEPGQDIGKCILCGLCVRVCDKLVGASAISFVRRGSQRRVRTPFNTSSDSCIGCNACVAVCPTDHIQTVDKGPTRYMQTWKTELDMLACESCGKSYIPAREFEHIQAKLGLQLTMEKICPICRRSQTAARLESASVGSPETSAAN